MIIAQDMISTSLSFLFLSLLQKPTASHGGLLLFLFSSRQDTTAFLCLCCYTVFGPENGGVLPLFSQPILRILKNSLFLFKLIDEQPFLRYIFKHVLGARKPLFEV